MTTRLSSPGFEPHDLFLEGEGVESSQNSSVQGHAESLTRSRLLEVLSLFAVLFGRRSAVLLRDRGGRRAPLSLAIPHCIVLFFLIVAAIVMVLIAWVGILITGIYPRALFDFVVGMIRWGTRVSAHAFLLVTDKVPDLPPPMTATH